MLAQVMFALAFIIAGLALGFECGLLAAKRALDRLLAEMQAERSNKSAS
jgi:hypothetical protein